MTEPVQFVDDSPQLALDECIADYQNISGRTLGAGDPEMLQITAFAYRLSLLRAQMNYTGNQNLLPFANGVALEVLGMKNGTFRLSASSARVTIRFTMAGGAPTLTIPAGTRVKSQDGAVMFETITVTNVTSGTATVDVDCICTTPGLMGNGYTAGMIINIVDPVAYVSSASNTDTSTGGSDQETDDQLRERIPLANATYSVAGPEDAYIYFAKTADPSIVDVRLTVGPEIGQIAVSSLYAGGTGYAVGDTFTLDGGAVLATGRVQTVSAGVVLTYKILNRGLGYATTIGNATTATSGSGTGLQIQINNVIGVMVIRIYPLLAGGVIPGSPMLNLVEATCSDKKVRPLTDYVVAEAPTAIDYSLDVQLTLKKNAPPGTAAKVLANLQGFVNQWDKALGVDLILDQFIGKCMEPGVYSVDIPSFTSDVTVEEYEFGNCTSLTVAVAATIDEL